MERRLNKELLAGKVSRKKAADKLAAKTKEKDEIIEELTRRVNELVDTE